MLDLVSLFAPISRYSAIVMEPENIPEIIRKAFQEAQGHNPGGAFVCLPENIAAEMVEDTDRPLSMRRPALPRPTEASIDYAVQLIHEYIPRYANRKAGGFQCHEYYPPRRRS